MSDIPHWTATNTHTHHLLQPNQTEPSSGNIPISTDPWPGNRVVEREDTRWKLFKEER